ncbi:MAG: class I SAM-dependent methyltransferase [Actinomycetota bacterium]|nr:class I SAM-dependent methyltransferase [Actinomycetota bacterium]
MLVPKALRRLAPDRARDSPRLRALALASGLIPPRTMHSPAEARTIARLARGRRRVVELGVYEGSSAIVLCSVLGPESELHLIDPFVDATGWALPPDARPVEGATRRAVARAVRHGGPDGRGGPSVHWQIARSQDAGRAWSGIEVDLVFIDGDHSPPGCREDFEVWSRHLSADGAVAFHDARDGVPGGHGSAGPTSVVNALFRDRGEVAAQWRISEELDSLVVVSRRPGGTATAD